MKICLINPPKIRYYETLQLSEIVDIGLPLGVLYLSAVLEKEGHNVKIVDCLVSEDAKIQKIDDKKFRYGLPWRNLKNEIKKFKPDIAGISNQFTAQIENVIETSKVIKELDKSLPIIVGGPHISVDPINFLTKVNTVDIGIIGEGEAAILNMVDLYSGKKKIDDIKGIVYRKNKKIILNRDINFIKNLDILPLPAYHLIDMNSYLTLSKKRIYGRNKDEDYTIPMITSRGCPYNCIFCSIHLHMGKIWRAHSAEYVINHIKHVVDNYNIKQIQFEDDNLTLDSKRFDKILDGITKNKFDIRWYTPNGVRVDTLNRNLVRKSKKAGCKGFSIGVESGDQDILDGVIDKKLNLNDVVKFAKICKEEKIPLTAFFILGLPGETKENMKKTIKFAKFLKRKYNVSYGGGALQATPLLGTRLYQLCKEKGYLVKEVTPEILAKATHVGGEGIIQTEDFTPEDIYKINRKLIIENYLDCIRNPQIILSKLKFFMFDRSYKSKKIILKRILNLLK